MRNKPAEALLEELKSSMHASRFADPRFHRPDLLDLLLEECRDVQLANPNRAAGLAGWAIRIAERLRDDPGTARSAIVQARCLSANSHRLARLLDLADGDLSKTVEVLDPMPGSDESFRALYCRTLALVRWEQGRLDEALCLLCHALRLYESKDTAEGKTCSFLLALLHAEMGLPEGVLAFAEPLLGDWFEPSCRPWLTSRALLTLAAAAADECLSTANFSLYEGIRFQAFVSDPDEQHRLYLLEGRARARLGSVYEAEQLIEAVRRQYLAVGRVFDLTLSTLDLLAVRLASAQSPGIDPLLDDIASIAGTALDLATAAIDRFVSCFWGGKDSWTSQRIAATEYLQAHRLRGIHPPPLPFA